MAHLAGELLLNVIFQNLELFKIVLFVLLLLRLSVLMSCHMKEIAYRKPFSIKIKSHLLQILNEKSKNLSITYWYDENSPCNELQEIFDDTGDDSTFYGFDLNPPNTAENS